MRLTSKGGFLSSNGGTLPGRAPDRRASTHHRPVSLRRLILAAATVMAGALTATLGTAPGTPALAEPISFFLPDGITYDSTVTTPEESLGFGLGERPVRHEAMVTYLRDLAQNSDRMTVETIGRSHEGRPILFFTVSAPENLARIEEIRQAHLADIYGGNRAENPALNPSPNQGAGEGAGQDGGRDGGLGGTRNGDQPVITWINYGVHGAEASGMDAAIPALYHLAAAQGPEIERTLKDSVILITAIFNPDGHTRRVDHVERFSSAVPVTDPAHAQHQLWIKARTNHYWFDLNRQWLLLTQPESRAWISQWQRWKPHVSADYHEMSNPQSTYYFHPGVPTRRNPLIPDESRALLDRIAGYHVRWLDSEGRLYFTEEGFDNFYIGKGSTYPHVNGSIGILFEALSARGGRLETPNGEITYADNIRTHFRTTLTTIEGTLAIADDLRAYKRRFYDMALEDAAEDERKAFVLQATGDAARLHRFIRLLKSHAIDGFTLARDLDVGGTTYRAGEAIVVPTNQRQYRMIRGIFDRPTEFIDPVFYDVSGWTLPLAYGLEYQALGADLFSSGMMGEDMDARSFPVFAAPDPETATYGYMFEWSNTYAPRALYRLLGADILARAVFEPVTVETPDGQVAFGRGSVFVPLVGQTVSREEIDQVIARIGEEDGLRVHGLTSGRSFEPGRDLGAPTSARSLEKPSALLLYEGGLSAYDTGELWHLLDREMAIPVTLMNVDRLPGGLDWSRYTHILMSGNAPDLSDAAVERMTQWIREEGGVVYAARGAALFAQDTFLTPAAKDEDDEEDKPETETETETGRFDYENLSRRNAEHVIGGAIFASDLDITHPLGFGLTRRQAASHRNTTIALDTPESPIATVARYADTPLLAGYASPMRQEDLTGTPMLVAERLGRGAVVITPDNLTFRATFPGTDKIILNALYFADSINRFRSPDESSTTDDHHHEF